VSVWCFTAEEKFAPPACASDLEPGPSVRVGRSISGVELGKAVPRPSRTGGG